MFQAKERADSIPTAYQNIKDSRIPQPSIINSATGNMNMKQQNQENEQPYLSQNSNSNVNLNHSKGHIDQNSFI